MKFLLIGNGKMGSKYIDTLQSFSRIQLEIATKENWRQEIESKQYQGAIIATQPKYHIEIAEHALLYNLPIIIEKPVCFSIEELNKLNKFSYLIPIIVNYIHLFSENYQALKKDIDPNAIISIESQGSNFGPYREYSALWDYGPHDLSMILDLLGENPISQTCYFAKNNYEIHLKFKNECFSKSLISNNLPKCRNLIVKTSKIYQYDGLIKTDMSPLYNLLKVFIQAIQGKFDYRIGLKLSHDITELLSFFDSIDIDHN